MARPKITLYVDTVSPFAYIAYHVLRHDAVFASCDVTYIPIFLGGLMKMCGNQPPISIKNKAEWTNKERLRWASLFNVPMKKEMPPKFPPLTLPTMRALAALEKLDGGSQERLVHVVDTLYDEFFVKHSPVHEPSELRRVLSAVLGSEAEADRVLEKATSDAEDGGKKGLSRNTEAAFEDGAFGLPLIVCTRADGKTESFWGVDHFGLVTAFLGLEKPGTTAWKALL